MMRRQAETHTDSVTLLHGPRIQRTVIPAQQQSEQVMHRPGASTFRPPCEWLLARSPPSGMRKLAPCSEFAQR